MFTLLLQIELKNMNPIVNDEEIEPDNFVFIPPLGLPALWIEVTDPDEEDELYDGCRVLAYRHRRGPDSFLPKTPVKEYGTVLKKTGQLVYLIQFDDGDRTPLGRHFIEVISKKSYFCNLENGLYAWSIEEAVVAEKNYVENKITISCPILIDSKAWGSLHKK